MQDVLGHVGREEVLLAELVERRKQRDSQTADSEDETRDPPPLESTRAGLLARGAVAPRVDGQVAHEGGDDQRLEPPD